MRRKLLSNIIRGVFILGFLFAFSASEAQIAAWNMETATNPPLSSAGVGFASVVNPTPSEIITPQVQTLQGSASICTTASTGFAWAMNPFDPGAVNESNGVQFTANTTGKDNITVKWDQRCSDAAANTVRVMYTTDGSTWVPFTMTSGNTTFCGGSINGNGCFEFDAGSATRNIQVDFSAITAVNNNSNFGVRFLASHYQGTGQYRQANAPGSVAVVAGTWRFDNVVIAGTNVVPPSSIVMSGSPLTICNGDTANLSLTFTGGTGPFTFTYNDPVAGNQVIANYVSGTAIPVTPTNTRTYSYVSLQHASGTVTLPPTSVTINVTTLPTITASAAATAVCYSAGSQTTNYAYSSFFGSPTPNRYSITWNASPANTFAPLTNIVVTTSPIVITVPAGTAPGTYTGYLTIKNSGAGTCPSLPKTFTLTVNSPTVIVTPPSSSAQTFCTGESSTPLSVSATGTGLAYQWRYDVNSTPGGSSAAVGTLNLPTFTPTVTGYYFVRVSSSSCTAVDSGYTGLITVVPGTVAGSVAGAQTICAGETPGTSFVLSGNTGTVVKWERANDIGFTTGLADISSTATTLTGASLVSLSSPITQTTYVRAHVQNGSCSILTTAPIQILVKSTTWTDTPMPLHWTNGDPDSSTTAIFDADYASAGNLSACSAQVNSGKNIVFNSGDILTLQNGLTVVGTLTFEDKASLMQINSTAVNTGDIIYKRKTPTTITNFDYTYWSSPVEVQTLANFSPFTLSDKYFWFDPIPYIWSAAPLAGNINMTPGQGYIVRGPQFLAGSPDYWEGVFTGKPNNGNYTPEISGTNSVVFTDSTHDRNCLGNPYPSAISADLLMSLNPTTLGTGTTIYFWTHNTPIAGGNYTSNDFAVYNYTGGAGTIKAPSANTGGLNANIPNGKIAAGQGFVIKAIATGPVTFTNAMRLGAANDNDQFYRTNENPAPLTNLERHRVWLELENAEGAYKQILIGYIENASNSYEAGYDGEPLEAGNPVCFYSVLDDKKLAIQGRRLPFDAADVIPLGFKIQTAGTYTINLSDYDGMFSDESVAVYLEDKLLNIVHDLRQDKYSFTTESGTFDTRFVLKYSTTLGTDHPTLDSGSIIVYKNKDQIVIRSGNTIMKEVKVYDVSGRLLFEKDTVNANETSIVSGSVREVLLVLITSENNQTVTKKIVN